MGAIIAWGIGMVFDPTPGGIFCVDGLCKNSVQFQRLIEIVFWLLIFFLTVFNWFMFGMRLGRRHGNKTRTYCYKLLSTEAFVPLVFVETFYAALGNFDSYLIYTFFLMLIGVTVTWIPAFRKRLIDYSPKPKHKL